MEEEISFRRIAFSFPGALAAYLYISVSLGAILFGDPAGFQRAGAIGIAAAIISSMAIRSQLLDASYIHKRIDNLQLMSMLIYKASQKSSASLSVSHAGQMEFNTDRTSPLKGVEEGVEDMNSSSVLDFYAWEIERQGFVQRRQAFLKTAERVTLIEVAMVSLATLQTGYGDKVMIWASALLKSHLTAANS